MARLSVGSFSARAGGRCSEQVPGAHNGSATPGIASSELTRIGITPRKENCRVRKPSSYNFQLGESCLDLNVLNLLLLCRSRV